jgi:hypothetical protein
MKLTSLFVLAALMFAHVLPAISRQNPSSAALIMPKSASPRSRPAAPPPAVDSTVAPAVLGDSVSVHASGHGKPWINLGDGHELLSSYSGQTTLISQMQAGQARPLSLAAADLDGDGVPDLLSGFATLSGGIIAVYRGNVDSIYPNSRQALARKSSGTFTDAPFLSPARLFEVPSAPDFMETGDFNGDGFTDVAIASRGSSTLYILPGDGGGGLDAAKTIELPGEVTAMASGDVNRRDGLTDLVVGVTGEGGPKLLVFEDPEGALKSTPEVISLPGEATAISVGYLYNNTYADIAVGAGRYLVTVHGRDRELSMNAAARAEVPPAVVSKLALPATPRAIAIGKFNADQSSQAAVLMDDGRIEMAGVGDPPAENLQVMKVTSVAPGGAGPGARLVRARVSGRAGDDLILTDQAKSRLRIMVGAAGPSSGNASGSAENSDTARNDVEPIDLGVDDTPIAVLPMRLNVSARNDLVVLRQNHVNASVVPAQFDNVFTVTSAADDPEGTCEYTLTPMSQTFGPGNPAEGGGAKGSFTVTTTDTCSYSPLASASWVTITSGAGPFFGSGTVTFTVADNLTDAQRTSSITVAPGVAFTVNQQSPPTDLASTRKDSSTGSGVAYQEVGPTAVSGTLRDTINAAVSAPSGTSNEIVFNIPQTGVPAIMLGAALPSLPAGSSLTIDGTTQAQAGGTALIEINGAGTNVLVVPGTSDVIRGLVINNSGVPIQLNGGGNKIVEGNFVGTAVDGASPLANSGSGVVVDGGSDNMIGGTAAAASNVIGASGGDGITITNNAAGSMVLGNFVGTDQTHKINLGNKGNGINVQEGASATTLGSTTSPNYFNSNGLDGVAVSSGTNHLIHNNAIQGNGGNGLSISAQTSTIGGDQGANLGNGLWQNSQNGLVIGSGATGIHVQGNGIGVAFADGTPEPFPNTLDGVSISAQKNLIGGVQVSLGNDIAFNGGDGVAVVSGTRNGILSNVIAANSPALAIHLFPGTNNNAHPPVISHAAVTAGASPSTAASSSGLAGSMQSAEVVQASSPVMVISFAFKSTPNATFNMQFYVPQICNCTNCFTSVGIYSKQVTTDATGKAPSPISIALTAVPAPGSFVNATATGSADSTSEFSECVEVGSVSACEYTLSATSDEISSSGGSGSFGVTTSSTCSYSPSDPDSWVHITSGAGVGNGTVTFNVDANPGTSSRTSTITVASGVDFTVIEDGVGPDFSLTLSSGTVSGTPGTVVPLTVTVKRSGGFTGAVTVTPPAKADGVKPKPGTSTKLPGTSTSYTLNIKITSSAVPGTYQFTFSATGAGLTGTRTANLSVTVE